ncbi:uncharacterized protein BT62DRAFT_1013285 [Guyanagaster necrorhizus]|uniref:Uncharacterized protein n=1 Tax=Guyanagaster necrorhizus TaxID=856835 RepID=A0A9P7VFV4_9AGAR|nr:uncharacterized protein BT62DRAFT_1013285 [Guyanagaster necrorhizus MCA 3950]KAG7439944.1 hypothetical protein BT62DRAFT_1013285 [Guyanagaster necrorhizus MCA 3950]
MDEKGMENLAAKAQELTTPGRCLSKDDVLSIYDILSCTTVGTVLTMKERFSLGSVIGIQRHSPNPQYMPRRFSQLQFLASIPLRRRSLTEHLKLPNDGLVFSCSIAKIHQHLLIRPIYSTSSPCGDESDTKICDFAPIDHCVSAEMNASFAQAVQIPRAHRHTGMDHIGVDWYSALLFEVHPDSSSSQLRLHISSGNIYLAVRPPHEISTPGLEGQACKPEFVWSLTPDFGEIISTENTKNIFKIRIRETAVYGACVLERRDYGFLRTIHEACGFKNKHDGKDISCFFDFPQMTMYPCQPYIGYRLQGWPACDACWGVHIPLVDNFGIDWATTPPSPLSSRLPSSCSNHSMSVQCTSSISELSTRPWWSISRLNVFMAILGLLTIFVVSRDGILGHDEAHFTIRYGGDDGESNPL